MHTLTALHPFAHTASCLHAIPCSLVSPGTVKLLLSRALRLLQVPQKHVPYHYHMRSHVYTLTGAQRIYTQAKACRAHMPFTHSCVHSTPTQTQIWILAGCTYSNHTPTPDTHMCACMTYYALVSTHHSHIHATRWDLQGAWAEKMSREAGTDRKLQSPASPPGAAAQPAVPTWALKGSPWAQSSHHLRQ